MSAALKRYAAVWRALLQPNAQYSITESLASPWFAAAGDRQTALNEALVFSLLHDWADGLPLVTALIRAGADPRWQQDVFIALARQFEDDSHSQNRGSGSLALLLMAVDAKAALVAGGVANGSPKAVDWVAELAKPYTKDDKKRLVDYGLSRLQEEPAALMWLCLTEEPPTRRLMGGNTCTFRHGWNDFAHDLPITVVSIALDLVEAKWESDVANELNAIGGWRYLQADLNGDDDGRTNYGFVSQSSPIALLWAPETGAENEQRARTNRSGDEICFLVSGEVGLSKPRRSDGYGDLGVYVGERRHLDVLAERLVAHLTLEDLRSKITAAIVASEKALKALADSGRTVFDFSASPVLPDCDDYLSRNGKLLRESAEMFGALAESVSAPQLLKPVPKLRARKRNSP